MTNLLYRASTSSTPPTTNNAKGSPITTTEFDANLKSLSDDIATRAPLISPVLLGTPTAPTVASGTSNTQIATTAFVTAADLLKADLESPSLVGIPRAPTAVLGTETTQIATTAFVTAERAASATLTNKTLTSPTINTPTITNPINTEVTLTDAVSTTWDMNSGHIAKWTITATGRALAAPTNFKVGGQYVLFVGLVTPSTMTPTWPSTIKWNYDIPPDLTTSSWTVISLVWSTVHGKFLGSYSPGF